MVDFKKLGRQRDIRPEIAALVERGSITREEVKDLRCNSDEWHAVYLAMDDEAFVEAFQYTLKNCRNHARQITYDDVAIDLFGPEIIRRFALKRLELAAQVPVLLEAVEENLQRAVLAEEKLKACEVGTGMGDGHEDLIRVLEGRVARAEREVAELRKGYDKLDASWAEVHAAAMDPIREAMGDPHATVPEVVECIRRKR